MSMFLPNISSQSLLRSDAFIRNGDVWPTLWINAMYVEGVWSDGRCCAAHKRARWLGPWVENQSQFFLAMEGENEGY